LPDQVENNIFTPKLKSCFQIRLHFGNTRRNSKSSGRAA